MADSKFGALVLIITIGFIVAGLPAALAEGAVSNSVGNEPITVDYSNESSVDESGVDYNSSVTITADGTTLEDGTDYVWDDSTGNVTWNDTAATTDGEQAYISYDVEQITDESNQLARIVSAYTLPLALLVLLILGLSAYAAVN